MSDPTNPSWDAIPEDPSLPGERAWVGSDSRAVVPGDAGLGARQDVPPTEAGLGDADLGGTDAEEPELGWPQEHDVDPEVVAQHDATGLDLATMIAHGAKGRRFRKKTGPRAPKPSTPTFSGASADDRDPRPLGQAFARLTAERGWAKELSVHVLLHRWDALVGPTNAAHSQPESYESSVLTVRCDSTAWATNLRMMASTLLARLNDELGQGTVTRVVIKGPDAPSWKHGKRSVHDGRGPRDTYG